jgi:hypothetical protein
VITPRSNFGGNNNQTLNLAQITQLLKQAQQNSNGGNNSGDNETRDNSRKPSEQSVGKNNSGIYANLNNCFSFNNLIKSSGQAVSPLHEFQDKMKYQNNNSHVSKEQLSHSSRSSQVLSHSDKV